ncbi:hypothetical protein P3T40_000328 [Paraburkholderia sp. EB58]|jgi:hypothetical protein|uniref:hypothetical protein n=1 Tax=Paraburkholderia sp. EB58 TaxID=3035125 RepID=UPI003D19FAEE
MNHHDVEQELQHLEYVFAHLSPKSTVPPLGYWRGRLNSLRKIPIVPSQRERINRLEQLLGTLELAVASGSESTPKETLPRAATRSRR